jgi:hypothetical protein
MAIRPSFPHLREGGFIGACILRDIEQRRREPVAEKLVPQAVQKFRPARESQSHGLVVGSRMGHEFGQPRRVQQTGRDAPGKSAARARQHP